MEPPSRRLPSACRAALLIAAVGAVAVLGGACNSLSGVGDLTFVAPTASATGFSGGAGECAPGGVEPCYGGPAGTEGVGVCHAGERTCDAAGAFGSCQGEVLPATDDCVTVADEDCDGSTPPCTGDLEWALQLGDAGSDRALGVAVDAAGEIVIAGAMQGTIDFGGGPVQAPSTTSTSAFVAKRDARGGHLWSHAFGSGTASGSGLALGSAGAVLFSGYFSGDINLGGGVLSVAPVSTHGFVAEFDAAGGHVWSRSVGADVTLLLRAATGPAGERFVAGCTRGPMTVDQVALECADSCDFVLALDAAGDALWGRAFPVGTALDYDVALAATAAGGALLSGTFTGPVDFGGGPVMGGADDGFLVELDAEGEHVRSASFGDVANDHRFGLSVDATTGDVLVTGANTGTVFFGSSTVPGPGLFMARLEASGLPRWVAGYGDGSAPQKGRDVRTDPLGNVLAVGSFTGTLDLGGTPLVASESADAFIAKLSPGGQPVWSRSASGAGDQLAVSVAPAPDASVVVAGYFTGALEIGGSTFASAGEDDIVILKLRP